MIPKSFKWQNLRDRLQLEKMTFLLENFNPSQREGAFLDMWKTVAREASCLKYFSMLKFFPNTAQDEASTLDVSKVLWLQCFEIYIQYRLYRLVH